MKTQIKTFREKLLNSKSNFIYFLASRMWSFLYALQLSFEFFNLKYYWINLLNDVKDNISNCDAIYKYKI